MIIEAGKQSNFAMSVISSDFIIFDTHWDTLKLHKGRILFCKFFMYIIQCLSN